MTDDRCLCRYLTPERAARAGVAIEPWLRRVRMVCIFCSRAGLSFPPERKPDPRAGLCTHEGCDNGASHERTRLCDKHYYWRRSA